MMGEIEPSIRRCAALRTWPPESFTSCGTLWQLLMDSPKNLNAWRHQNLRGPCAKDGAPNLDTHDNDLPSS